ncbi:MAG: hypothetical protein JWP01_866 [Myxococcales bacterium]|nr:hypothetical protein [Myxococcales bacterium]
MTLARDERIGLLIAAIVGAAAIGNYAYRESKRVRPQAATPAAPVHEIVDHQAARDDYATLLQRAFEIEQNVATVRTDGTTLLIRWEMCSKQMLQRLLHDAQNFQVKSVREVSGLSVKRLTSHGFKKIVCDDGRKGLTPSSVAL